MKTQRRVRNLPAQPPCAISDDARAWKWLPALGLPLPAVGHAPRDSLITPYFDTSLLRAVRGSVGLQLGQSLRCPLLASGTGESGSWLPASKSYSLLSLFSRNQRAANLFAVELPGLGRTDDGEACRLKIEGAGVQLVESTTGADIDERVGPRGEGLAMVAAV